MIDFHNHVLPNIDDGPNTLEMSIEMLRHAAEQGITDVVNTVHYQHPKVENKDISHNRIQKAINDLQMKLDQKKIPINLHCGAEVFFLPNLLEIKKDPLSSFIHGKYMLIEFQTHQLPDIHKEQLFNLKMSGVTPIIAHPERYKPVQDDYTIITDWLGAGCIIQIDTGSILGIFGKEAYKASETIIKNGWCQIIGSDAHNNRKRNFNLSRSVEVVREWIGNDVIAMVYDNPRAVIEGDLINVEFDYEVENSPNFFTRIKNTIGLI